MDITSRLKLRKPGLPDPEEEEDYNFNYDILDNSPGFYICTSTTRPTQNLFMRQMIYETDNKSIKTWNGTEWIPVSPMPCAQMYRAADYSINFGWYDFDFDTIAFDAWNMASVSTNYFTIPYAGLWYFNFYWTIGVGYNANMIAGVIDEVTPQEITLGQVEISTKFDASRGHVCPVETTAILPKGATVRAKLNNQYGAAVNVIAGLHFNAFTAIYLGDQ